MHLLIAVCQSGLCRTKRFGVGYGEEEMPSVGNLTKYASKPPQWFLDVSGSRIELKSEQLYSPGIFALACLDQANLVVPVPETKRLETIFLKPMMTNIQEVEPLESLDPVNEFTNLLQDWTTNRQSARTWMMYLINYHTQMRKESLHILEWKIFLIFVKEIIGKKTKKNR